MDSTKNKHDANEDDVTLFAIGSQLKFDLPTALNEYLALSRGRRFRAAEDYFKSVLEPFESCFPIFAEHALSLFRQGAFENLTKLTSKTDNRIYRREEQGFVYLCIALIRCVTAQPYVVARKPSLWFKRRNLPDLTETEVCSSIMEFQSPLLMISDRAKHSYCG